jgi:hypothetical protein
MAPQTHRRIQIATSRPGLEDGDDRLHEDRDVIRH